MNKKTLLIVCAAAVTLSVASSSWAAPIILKDKDSSAIYNIAGGAPLQANGMYFWDRNNAVFGGYGPDHLVDAVQKSYYFRSGSMASEKDVNTLSLLSAVAINTNADLNADRLVAKYQQTTGPDLFTITVSETLRGSSSGVFLSSISRSVTVKNDGTSNLTFSFFSYSHLKLTGLVGDQVSQNPLWAPGDAYTNLPGNQAPEFATIKTVDGKTKVAQYDLHALVGTRSMAETIVLGPPNHNGARPDRVQASVFGPGGVKASLDDGAVTTLANTNFLPNQDFGTTGTGVIGDEIETAFQWDFVLAPGSSFTILEGTQIVPEPATLALLGIGAALIALRRR